MNITVRLIPAPQNICCADVSGNGQITSYDASLILQIVAGTRQSPGTCLGGTTTSTTTTTTIPARHDSSISIATLKDTYNIGERVELTDPPEFTNNEFVNQQLDQGNLVVQRDGQVMSTQQEFPQFNGYIVQFEEKPVVERKLELERAANANERSLLRPVYRTASYVLPTNLEPVLESNIKDKINAHSTNLVNEHSRVKQRILNQLNKNQFTNRITGRAVGVSQDEIELLGEYSKTFNGIALDISGEEAEEIKELDGVKEVYPNYIANITLMDSVPLIGAPEVWQLNDAQGNPITGKGVTIAIIDTGVDYTHPDLGGCFGPGCKVVGGYDFINNDNDPMDDHGHGTHVAATAAGNGDWDKDGILEQGEGLNGVAPDADIIAYKVLGSGGSGSFDGIISAIEHAIDPNQDNDFSDHVDIISMSLGGWGDPDDPMSQSVDNAVDAGVVAVIAAGNAGGESTIGSPGTARKAITVGAADKQDSIAPFSSRGPVLWKENVIIKPDIVAPGVDICAAQWDSAWDDRKCYDDSHIAISGTSMATPHVAGAVALLKQKYPDWTPEEIKMTLRNTAVDIGEGVISQGYGRIDILESINSEKPPIAILESLPIIANQENFNVKGTATSDNFKGYSLYYAHGLNPEVFTELYSSTNIIKDGTLFSGFDTSLLEEGYNTIKLVATDNNGISSEDRNLVFKIEGVKEGFPVHIEREYANNVYAGNAFGLTITDINKDGRNEIIIKNPPYLSIYNNQGNLLDGWPQFIRYYTLCSNACPLPPISVGDIDADLDLEIVSGGYESPGHFFTDANDVQILESKALLSFEADGSAVDGWPIKIPCENCQYIYLVFQSVVLAPILGGDNLETIVFAIVERYGEKEGILYAFNSEGNILDGNWPVQMPSYIHKWWYADSPVVGDVNFDGDLEIVVAYAVSDYDSEGNWAPETIIKIIDKYGNIENEFSVFELIISPPLLLDIDKDGDLEIVLQTFAGIQIINHDGTIDKKIGGWTIAPYSLAVGDVNNDGEIEFFYGKRLNSDQGEFYLSDKTGNILPGWPIEFNSPGYGYESKMPTIVGDVDGDSYPDVVFATWDRNVYGLNYKGELILHKKMYTQIGSGISIDDIDSDGLADLVFIADDWKIYAFELDVPYNPATMEWPMFQHDPQHTGNYHTGKERITPQPRPQSKLVNNEYFDLTGYLTIKIQKQIQGNWVDYQTIVNNLQKTIPSNNLIKLDLIFNPTGFTPTEAGQYRVIAEFKDSNENILKTLDGELTASWEFSVI